MEPSCVPEDLKLITLFALGSVPRSLRFHKSLRVCALLVALLPGLASGQMKLSFPLPVPLQTHQDEDSYQHLHL